LGGLAGKVKTLEDSLAAARRENEELLKRLQQQAAKAPAPARKDSVPVDDATDPEESAEGGEEAGVSAHQRPCLLAILVSVLSSS
jgi:hypothetical protein